MNIQEKLKLIQKLSGMTQEQMAHALGVTFAALNRWMNKKAEPRAKAIAKIDDLYFKYSGEKKIPDSLLSAKRRVVLQKQKRHKHILREILENKDIFDQFLLSLTYNSNRIEGSSLSEGDTAAILFDNVSLPNKSLVEQLEAKNHQTALEYLFDHIQKKAKIDEDLILKLHAILMNSIRTDAGNYRRHGVRIVGTYVPTVNYLRVPEKMKELVREINKKNGNIIVQAAIIHAEFEQIHPFSDGNGRVGRLLAHAMLLKANLPPAIIKQNDKKIYNKYLNKAQLEEKFDLLEDFFYDATLAGYDIVERKLAK
jgi:Fic family protein/DNA-binding XRE family transcriptional regulator